MRSMRWYGPALVLLMAALGVVIAGPTVARKLAYENRSTEIKLIKDSLASDSSLAQMSQAFKDVAKAVEPSVVYIDVYSKKPRQRTTMRLPNDDFFRHFFGPLPPGMQGPDQGDDEQGQGNDDSPRRGQPNDGDKYNVPRPYGSGSGWVYTADGYIITNNHVIEDADQIKVHFFDGSERDAVVKGADPKTDVAVIKVDGPPQHAATLATAAVDQGEIVFAFGAPFRFQFSMSQGIVSGMGRQLNIVDSGHGYENFIQTDAAINPGNSGGPLTNIYGQVVGMNTAIASSTGSFNGLGFAIPVDMVKKVADELIAKGKVVRGYAGIFIEPLDPKMAKSFGFDGKGVLVANPIAGGPADQAGVQRGDIVTKVDGTPVATPDELRNFIADISPGTKVRLEIYRQGKTLEKTITAAALPDKVALAQSGPDDDGGRSGAPAPDRAARRTLRQLGLDNVTSMSDDLAQRYRIPMREGVLVLEVRPDSTAAAEGMAKGDVITDVMGVKVASVEELGAQLGKYDLHKGVRLSIRSGDQERFVLLELPGE